MKSVISKNKKTITLENGESFEVQGSESVADFMQRVRKFVKDEYLDDLVIEKEGGVNAPKTPAKSDPKIKKAMSAEEKEAAEAKKKEAAEARAKAREEARLAREAEKEKMKKLKEEEKAKLKAEKEAQKEKELEEYNKKQAELVKAKAKELVDVAKVRSKEHIAEVKEKAARMIEESKIEAEEIIKKAQADAERMIETGSIGVDQLLLQVAKSHKGLRCSFLPFGAKEGEETHGVVVNASADKRSDSVYYRIKGDDGKIYHKNAESGGVNVEMPDLVADEN